MPKLGPFPSKEADLNIYFQAAVPYLIANKARLLVSEPNQLSMAAQLANWNLAFPASQNANTRTKSAVENKDNAKEALMETLRLVYADIPNSKLTVEDRNLLNLQERSSSRTAAPMPSTKPIGQIDTSKRLEHTISFTDQDGSAAKPEGARGCQIWYKIGEAATDPSQLSFMTTDTASPYTHIFAGEDAGKTVHYWLRWENTRGETGPWSDVVMATITG